MNNWEETPCEYFQRIIREYEDEQRYEYKLMLEELAYEEYLEELKEYEP